MCKVWIGGWFKNGDFCMFDYLRGLRRAYIQLPWYVVDGSQQQDLVLFGKHVSEVL